MIIATKHQVHVLHDSTAVPTGNGGFNHGFIPDIDGNFDGRGRHDAADRKFYVKGGQYYGHELALAKLTGAVGVTELLIVIEARILRD